MINDRLDHSLVFEMLSALSVPDEEMFAAPVRTMQWTDALMGLDAFLIGILALLLLFLVLLGTEIRRSILIAFERQ